MSNSFTWPIDKTLSGATTLGQSGPGSDANEEVLCIPQYSRITKVSPLDQFMSYLGHSMGKSHPSAEIQWVYSAALAVWVREEKEKKVWFGLVWFYGISTIEGYLMPNPFYTYILNIWFLREREERKRRESRKITEE